MRLNQTSRLIDLDLSEYPSMNEHARNLIRGARIYDHVRKYVDWLDEMMSQIPNRHRKDVLGRFKGKDLNNAVAVEAELVMMALWQHLDWRQQKDPKMGRLCPDFLVTASLAKATTRKFVCETTVIRHNHPHHHSAIGPNGKITVDGRIVDRFPPLTQHIDQAHRIINEVLQKFEKYSTLNGRIPLVIALYIHDAGSQFYLDEHQIRTALYGDWVIDFGTGKSLLNPKLVQLARGQKGHRGIFAFPKYQRISAVLTCIEKSVPIADPDEEGFQPWSIVYDFKAYCNPCSEWVKPSDNPLHSAGIPTEGLDGKLQMDPLSPVEIAFYHCRTPH